MATNVSLSRVNHLMDRVKRLQVSRQHAIHKAKSSLVMVADAAVVNLGAFGLGMVQGRFGEKKILGIPVEIATAALFHGAGLMEVGGHGMTKQFHNLGNGALCAYTAALGRGVGKRMRAKSGLPALSGLDKALDQLNGEDKGGGGHDDEQLMKLARRL